ncbi:MAG TPA: nicotinate (nicotinamide) nucleotide adenylyltransferase [Aridibacter sp.]|nr:nicotinate (nicotinamide) nucleotide adenylyltransferase [Aridibacter sp.]
MSDEAARKKIAFFGGSFDPVHVGHIEIANTLVTEFGLDVFVFVPAFRAPHKWEFDPASPYHRFAMLALATDGLEDVGISTIEMEDPDRPYTIETMEKVKANFPGTEIFFVIGADSWMDITTWRNWEEVLTSTNIIVVTRPGFEIGFSHLTDEIRERIVDLRRQNSEVRSQENDVGAGPVPAPGNVGAGPVPAPAEDQDSEVRNQESESGAQATGLINSLRGTEGNKNEIGDGSQAGETPSQSSVLSPHSFAIYITDSVNVDISATALRKMIGKGEEGWEKIVPTAVARHIVKYGLYK